MNHTDNTPAPQFSDFELIPAVLDGIQKAGYDKPSPIQAEAIPHLLEGRDILAQAQTGTGKTAAFALPILSQIDVKNRSPQALVLAPTRELAQQVADAFKVYASGIKGLKVLALCGGQDYRHQLKELDYGMHVIVGTPGRVMDHMRRGSLDVDGLTHMVLDEADEMLKMGFIDDITWVLERTPEDKQTALFSATMPKPIRSIAQRHLTNPKNILIASKTTTTTLVEQTAMILRHQGEKNRALLHVLEAEEMHGAIIFVRTKSDTESLSEMLTDAGHKSVALNGDMPQNKRERTIQSIRDKKADILVATDVAARGIDIQHLSHVINYDIPYDTESYVHRIGRTGRAGNEGKAILFVNPRERHHLRSIERETRQKIKMVEPPTIKEVNQMRVANFKKRIDATFAQRDLSFFYQLIQEYQQENDLPPLEIAAALAQMAQGKESLILKDEPKPKKAKIFGKKKRDFNDRDKRSFGGKKRFSGGGRDNRDGYKGKRSGDRFSGGREERGGTRSEGNRYSGKKDGRGYSHSGEKRGNHSAKGHGKRY